MYDDHPTGVSLFTFILLWSLRKQRKNNFHILFPIHFAVCTDLIIIGRRFFQFTVFVRCRTTFGYGLYFTTFSIFTVAAVDLITACTFYL